MIPRSAFACANILASRRIATRRLPQARFQSTGPSPAAGPSVLSHLAAGVAGGVAGSATVVLVGKIEHSSSRNVTHRISLAGYAYYHTSGLKAAVQTSNEVKQYLQDTKDSVVTKAKEASKDSSELLKYLRSVAKSYVIFIPGASGYVDKTFDELDELHKEHGEDMDKVLTEMKDELVKAAKEGQADTKTAAKVYGILSDGITKLQKLGKEAGKTVLEKNPKFKEKLGGGYEQLRSLAEKAGPEGKKTFGEVTNKVFFPLIAFA